MTSTEAANASRRALGNVLLAREDVRDVWLGSWAPWWQDVRYGVRTLRRNLFGVSPADPVGLGGATLLVLGVAAAAGVMAAGPATRADPTATLRYE